MHAGAERDRAQQRDQRQPRQAAAPRQDQLHHVPGNQPRHGRDPARVPRRRQQRHDRPDPRDRRRRAHAGAGPSTRSRSGRTRTTSRSRATRTAGPEGLGPDGRPDTGDDAHQDGAQIQGGNRIEFIDFTWGDWAARRATCQGAAGTFVPGSVNNWPVRNMACIRCKSVSCNHGMLLARSTGTVVVDSWWRSGNPAERRGILANGQTGLCNHSGGPCTINPGESTRAADRRQPLRQVPVLRLADRTPPAAKPLRGTPPPVRPVLTARARPRRNSMLRRGGWAD